MTARPLLRRYGDLALAVGLALLYVAELVAWSGAGTDKAMALPAGVASALALTFRRRSPLASFVLCLALTGVVQHAAPAFTHEAYAVLAIMLLNLYSLGANARGTEAWLGVAGLLANIALIAQSNGDLTAGGIAFYCAFCGLPWATGVTIRLRIERVRELEEHSAALREQAERAVADERARIARELHDVVSHAIAVTVLQARGARRRIGRDDGELRQAFGAIELTNTAALADMRRLLALLREPGAAAERDQPAPSLEQLDGLVEQMRSSGVAVRLEVVGQPLPLPPGLDLSAYRIVQEALTNVLKHAGPQARAHVTISYGTDALEISIVDSGHGPGPSYDMGGGHGLVGIRERAGILGGTVTAGPEAGGFAVRARLPYLSELVTTAGGTP